MMYRATHATDGRIVNLNPALVESVEPWEDSLLQNARTRVWLRSGRVVHVREDELAALVGLARAQKNQRDGMFDPSAVMG